MVNANAGGERSTCPVDHERLKLDNEAWLKLERIGIQPDFDDDGNRADLELRNCGECGSTLARPVRVYDCCDTCRAFDAAGFERMTSVTGKAA
jgi:hypothetical protein